MNRPIEACRKVPLHKGISSIPFPELPMPRRIIKRRAVSAPEPMPRLPISTGNGIVEEVSYPEQQPVDVREDRVDDMTEYVVEKIDNSDYQ